MPKKSAAVRSVAFLRGINVGGHRVAMAELKRHFEALKFANVSTFIASGNVIFEAPPQERAALERRIEVGLEQALGYAAPTFVRSAAEVASVAGFQPFGNNVEVGHTLHVLFLRTPPDAAWARSLPNFRTEKDDFRLEGSELFWHCRGKSLETQADWRALNKTLGAPTTARNITMLRKLAAKLRA